MENRDLLTIERGILKGIWKGNFGSLNAEDWVKKTLVMVVFSYGGYSAKGRKRRKRRFVS